MALLEVEDLSIWFHTRNGVARAVEGVSFALDAGETLAIVGESGSGKSVCCYSLLGLVPMPPGRIESGSARFAGRDLLRLPPRALRAVRGNEIATIFQDPMTCLNPFLTLGEQLMEPLRYHRKVSRKAARARALELLDEVGIVDAERRFDAYPHEFSGGMRQRVMIAMALALMAAIGTYMSGYLADKYAKRFPKALALIPMFALIGVIPMHVTGYLAESLWLAVPLMMVGQMLLYTYLCPLYACLLYTSPSPRD